MPKSKKSPTLSIEKTFALCGAALAALSVVASGYYLYVSTSFLHELVPDLVYYLAYMITLGGGFVAGYLLTPQGKKKGNDTKLFNGAVYSSFTMSLYFMIDLIRLAINNIAPSLTSPIDTVLFSYSSLISLIITIIVIYLLQTRPRKDQLVESVKWFLVLTFAASQAYYLAIGLYYALLPPAGLEQYSAPLWLTIGSFVMHPFVIALVAYFSFGKIKGFLQRAFYAVFVSGLVYFLMLVMWNFRSNPSLESTYLFQGAVFAISLVLAIGLIIKVRQTAK